MKLSQIVLKIILHHVPKMSRCKTARVCILGPKRWPLTKLVVSIPLARMVFLSVLAVLAVPSFPL